MKELVKKLTTFTAAFGVAILLAGCGGGCGEHEHHMKKHHMRHGNPQEVVMYEAVEVVEMEPMANPVMKAKIHTRSARGGTSEMGYIKFARGENGVKMMVDLIDLRPGKDYTVKIYPCGNCSDYSCCASKCMNINLPVLAIEEPGRLTQTYEVRGITCAELNNAKIVLMRDGGYKAAWGRIHPVSQH